GPGELENAVVCARRQAIAIHGQAEHRLGLWRRAAVSADEPRRHLSVAVDAWLAPESLTLSFTRRFDARAVVSARGFGLCRGSEAVALDAPGENRDVDPIEERTAHPSVVLENAVTRADAACPGHAEPAARARVHRCDEHHLRGVAHVVIGPRDVDHAVLERLPEHLEHVASKLRELVQEEHAPVGERKLARSTQWPAADEPS